MPIQAINYKIVSHNSILKSKIKLTYVNDSDSKIEAVLELPNNPDWVLSKLKIRVGAIEIKATIKEKERAH